LTFLLFQGASLQQAETALPDGRLGMALNDVIGSVELSQSAAPFIPETPAFGSLAEYVVNTVNALKASDPLYIESIDGNADEFIEMVKFDGVENEIIYTVQNLNTRPLLMQVQTSSDVTGVFTNVGEAKIVEAGQPVVTEIPSTQGKGFVKSTVTDTLDILVP